MKLEIGCMLIAIIILVSKSNGSSKEKPNNITNCNGFKGYFCSDDPAYCKTKFYCRPGLPVLAETCKNDLTCNAGECSSALSPTCEYRNQTFQCTSEGMYPEPSSCRRYNHCLPNMTNPIQSICEDGWAYNPATTFCDKQLPNYVCGDDDRLIPKCLTLGQNGALKANPVLYYVCLPYDNKQPTVLYPYLYKCPRNTTYAGSYICK